jgi:uncharacterized membrane protein
MWLQTGGYSLEALYWLIAVGVVAVVAIAALVMAIWLLARPRTVTAQTLPVEPEAAPAVEAAERPAAGPSEPRTPEALRLLDGRYANGEISREQYLQLEADLLSTAVRALTAAVESARDIAAAVPVGPADTSTVIAHPGLTPAGTGPVAASPAPAPKGAAFGMKSPEQTAKEWEF